MITRPVARSIRATASPADFPLDIIGRPVAILQPRRREPGGSGGGDLDIAVGTMHENWPLRLPSPWRVCQMLHYGLNGRCFILEAHGSALPIDVVSDPEGLGRDGMSTALLAPAGDRYPRPSSRAAYLCAKRILKDAATEDAWLIVFELASREPRRFDALCGPLFGSLAKDIVDCVRSGRVPGAHLRRKARGALLLRRFRTPIRAAKVLASNMQRLWERVRRPTGLTVVIAGPDGTGKTTLADALQDALGPFFRRRLRVHWRPGLLPRPGSIARREPRDYTAPQADRPHPRGVSLGLLLYYWVDFLAGAWMKVLPARLRSGLVVIERGWWDIAVDPVRYRLQVPGGLVRALGRLLPRPDATISLVGRSEVIAARKGEITIEETARQLMAWEALPAHALRRVTIRADRGAESAVADTCATLLDALEVRATRRFGHGWTGMGSGRRWMLPRGPGCVTKASLALYQPVTTRARVGWSAARALSGLGALRLLPRAPGPDPSVRRLVAPFLEPRETIAVMRSTHPHRSVVGLVGVERGLRAVAKVALDEAGRAALAREGHAIERYAGLLIPGVAAAMPLEQQDGVLLLDGVDWIPRRRPWELPLAVASALGRLHARGVRHGDAAPWNLLRTRGGWALLDWESAREADSPHFDVFHYLVQSFSLLGRPTGTEILRGIHGMGPLAAVLGAYEHAAGLPSGERQRWLVAYLDETMPPNDGRSDHVRGRANRLRLADRVRAAR